MNKTIQAKHIPDVDILRLIFDLSIGVKSRVYSEKDTGPDEWVFTWDIEKYLTDIPHKVVLAKLASLIKRELIKGVCPLQLPW